jgi:hypothetical protein
MVRLYGLIIQTNGIAPIVSGVPACAHASSLKGGGESHADLEREQRDAGRFDHEGLVVMARRS